MAAAPAQFEERVTPRQLTTGETLVVVETGKTVYKVTLELPGGDQKQDSPALFTVPNKSAILHGSISRALKDGTTREHRFAVRVTPYTESTVSLTYVGTADAGGGSATTGKAATASAVATHLGHVENCWNKSMRFDFMQDNKVAFSIAAPANQRTKDQEVAKGVYTVRRFAIAADAQTTFVAPNREGFRIETDGWQFAYGCAPAEAGKPWIGILKTGKVENCNPNMARAYLFMREGKVVYRYDMQAHATDQKKIPSGSYDVQEWEEQPPKYGNVGRGQQPKGEMKLVKTSEDVLINADGWRYPAHCRSGGAGVPADVPG